MIKKFTLLTVFVAIGMALWGQDLVVTEAGDSIRGAITRVSGDFLSITTAKGQGLVLKLDNLIGYEYNFEKVDENSKASLQSKGIVNTQNTLQWQRFRLAINGGYSYRLAKIPSVNNQEEKDYYSSLKSGFHFGGDFSYFFHRVWGIGLNYVGGYYNTTDFPKYDEETGISYRASDRISLQQIMATVNVRAVNKKNTNSYFLFTMGLGYVGYRDKGYIDGAHLLTMKGGTFAILTRIGYDISVSKNLAIVLQASLAGGVLSKVTLLDESTGQTKTYKAPEGEGEGLGRLEFSIGVRFGK